MDKTRHPQGQLQSWLPPLPPKAAWRFREKSQVFTCSALRNIRSPNRGLETGQGKQGAPPPLHTPLIAQNPSLQAP